MTVTTEDLSTCLRDLDRRLLLLDESAGSEMEIEGTGSGKSGPPPTYMTPPVAEEGANGARRRESENQRRTEKRMS